MSDMANDTASEQPAPAGAALEAETLFTPLAEGVAPPSETAQDASSSEAPEGIAPGGAVLEAELATQPRGVRPGELLAALDPSVELGLVRRTHQWIERDGARWEPLPPQATDAPHAEARAS